MKSVIIYYSYSGNTKKTADLLKEQLALKGPVDLIELKAFDEPGKFLKQCLRAFKHIKAKIQDTNFDLSGYDLICLGTPVWAFGPAPAMNAWLEQCFGLEGKEVILFTTYGSGTGNRRCLDFMQSALTKKGAKKYKRFSIQQFKVEDKKFVISEIEKTLRL